MDAKSYVLVSTLAPEVYSKYVEDKESAHLSGFAFVVISIVQLAGGKISEGNLSMFCTLVTETLWSDMSESCYSKSRGPLASVEATWIE